MFDLRYCVAKTVEEECSGSGSLVGRAPELGQHTDGSREAKRCGKSTSTVAQYR